jgi:hypothetical protein
MTSITRRKGTKGKGKRERTKGKGQKGNCIKPPRGVANSRTAKLMNEMGLKIGIDNIRQGTS